MLNDDEDKLKGLNRQPASESPRTTADQNGLSPWTPACGTQLALAYGRLGLTQRAFAERVDVDTMQVRRWVKAKAAPSAINRAALLEALGGPDAQLWKEATFADLGRALGACVATTPPPEPPSGQEEDDDGKPLWPILISVLAVMALAGGLLWWGQAHRLDPLDSVEPAHVGPWQLHYASGRMRSVLPQARLGMFLWRLADLKIVDVDADGDPEAVVPVLDAATPQSTTGQVSILRINRDGSMHPPAYVDEQPAYEDTTYSSTAWSFLPTLSVDCEGDGTLETGVVAQHTMFPSLFTIVSAENRRVRTYTHAGHIVAVAPLFAKSSDIAIAGAVNSAPRQLSGFALSAEFNEAPRSAGLVLLPPTWHSGSGPALTPHDRHTQLALLESARYIKFLPSLVAQRCPAGHNWPEKVSHDATTGTLQVTTIEEPNGDGVIRTLDAATLRQLRIIPTDRFRAKYVQLAMQYNLPPLESEELASSMETRAVWERDHWVDVRDVGAWQP